MNDYYIYSQLTLRTNAPDDTTVYIGQAKPGSDESAPVWQIKQITATGPNDVTILFANGNDDFLNIWDDRETLDYS